jgi:hypothetical protein
MVTAEKMEKSAMKEKIKEATQIYSRDKSRAHIRQMQDLSDEDLIKPVSRIKEKILEVFSASCE